MNTSKFNILLKILDMVKNWMPIFAALYFVTTIASKYVKVSLSGEGADEKEQAYGSGNGRPPEGRLIRTDWILA